MNPDLVWFQVSCHPPYNPTLHLFAADAEEAKQKYLKAVGIVSTPHPVNVTRVGDGFRPSEVDLRKNGLAA